MIKLKEPLISLLILFCILGIIFTILIRLSGECCNIISMVSNIETNAMALSVLYGLLAFLIFYTIKLLYNYLLNR